ncbi:putative monocarboxylate transporter mch1 [Paecilomyces lecythidis]|uniref:Probable transporter MCH1 n=1 Tax=Paecilomyces lecythidis TaxID=3004212 RepID=A0ABR3YEK2_9EURO
MRVNAVAITAELAMYLPVPFFGYLCDRYTPSPLALLSAIFFGTGYLLAAFTYKSGPPPDAGGSGWPFWVMIVSFVGVGAGTSCLYLAAVTTCAKNFARSRYKGLMLAAPIAAFGLSGMWQSQVGAHFLSERLEDGSKGDLDVFKYFLFLSIVLIAVSVIGVFGLRIVNEEEAIDEAYEELERSGILGESDFFRSRDEVRGAYGTFSRDEASDRDEEQSITLSDEEREARRREKEREEEERQRKNWLLNYETRLFLKDHTMWWLAAGFFLVTGPGEAYINNLGTIIQTLTPSSYPLHSQPPAGSPSTHVSTVALTSTLARLLTGSLSDLFAAPASHQYLYSLENPNREPVPRVDGLTLSRLTFLLPCGLLLSFGFLLLASPLPVHHPGLFHLTTTLVGFGYGATFSLVPIIISVVWGVENFGTNWGIVAMVPAAGAAVWGLVYSGAYDAASSPDGQCHGWKCYGFWAVGCTLSVWVALVAWAVAWRSWRRRGVVV